MSASKNLRMWEGDDVEELVLKVHAVTLQHDLSDELGDVAAVGGDVAGAGEITWNRLSALDEFKRLVLYSQGGAGQWEVVCGQVKGDETVQRMIKRLVLKKLELDRLCESERRGKLHQRHLLSIMHLLERQDVPQHPGAVTVVPCDDVGTGVIQRLLDKVTLLQQPGHFALFLLEGQPPEDHTPVTEEKRVAVGPDVFGHAHANSVVVHDRRIDF
eukprot:CAMPEP_0175833158 /NCGR_PEP_ID=MMETSP0107_2-20121207/15365_1 /TAXON_ID=195067 ORGANISM="Goniomonas pacifica, Strain CCMP1869" /NCGR_SAMPLE_ID=MMETSP0107_2 /ASSEMBLY_ACC=CAM_ASM_000203 /LENGTH=214 /DNA_ID=CAMNT_0017146277 /DNA_START=390 /DNA_END=1036 /DNA_ORIENTATION=+